MTLLMFLFSGLAIGAAVVVRIEVQVASRFRQSAEAFYAAQTALNVSISQLRLVSDWTPVIAGTQSSPLSQGAFLGSKMLPAGGAVDVCCGSGSLLDRLTAEARIAASPSRRSLEWRPFLWTTFDALAPGQVSGRLYLVVFVANDEEDAAAAAATDTNGLILLRAEAIDPGGLRRAIECLIGRPGAGRSTDNTADNDGALPPVVGIYSWREVR